MNMYANGIHQDFGKGRSSYIDNLNAYAEESGYKAETWEEKFDREEVQKFMMLCFWRPTNMEGKLQHQPLALLDPRTVKLDDIVPTGMIGFTKSGLATSQLMLKHSEDHMWYYFPDMTNDEVICFKQYELHKDETEETEFKTCMHSAFEDPNTPWFAEKRQSCEHRVGVYLKK